MMSGGRLTKSKSRHLGRNLAHVLDGRAIVELIKTREDKDAKQRQELGLSPNASYTKTDQEDRTSESGYWTPIAQARVRIVVIVLLAAAAPTLSILQSLLGPLTILDQIAPHLVHPWPGPLSLRPPIRRALPDQNPRVPQ